MTPPDFGRSVNPISTRGDRLCPPNYYWHPRIFRPSYGPVKCHHQTAYPRLPARPPSFLPAELLAWFLEPQAQWNSLKIGWDLGLIETRNLFLLKGDKTITLHTLSYVFCPQNGRCKTFLQYLVGRNPNPPHRSHRACQEAARGLQLPPPTCRSPKSVITYDKVHQAMPLSRLRLWLYTASHRGSVKCANIYSPPLGSISATA